VRRRPSDQDANMCSVSTRPKRIPGATRASVARLLDLGLVPGPDRQELGVFQADSLLHARMLGCLRTLISRDAMTGRAIRSFLRVGSLDDGLHGTLRIQPKRLVGCHTAPSHRSHARGLSLWKRSSPPDGGEIETTSSDASSCPASRRGRTKKKEKEKERRK